MNKLFSIEESSGLPKLSARITAAMETEAIINEMQYSDEDNIHALDIAQSLEDLHVVISSIKNISNVDMALIQCTANTSVAGTEMSAIDAMPALESFDSKEISLNNILQRIGQILNSLIYSISDQFENLEKLIRCIMAQLNQYKDVLIHIENSFPIPDLEEDDSPRTLVLKPVDATFISGSNGKAVKSYGDLINLFNNSVKDFNTLTAVTSSVGIRLVSAIRDIIPTADIVGCDDFTTKMKIANKSLQNTILEMWSNTVTKADLILCRENGYDVIGTRTMLGSTSLGLKLKIGNSAPTNDEQLETQCNEIISSFQVVKNNQDIITQPGETCFIEGTNNRGLRVLTKKIREFITDTEKYCIWCLTNASVVRTQCSSDIASIDKYFKADALSKIQESSGQSFVNFVEKHTGGIYSIVNTTIDSCQLPLLYANNMINGLVIILDSTEGSVPVGRYDQSKDTD